MVRCQWVAPETAPPSVFEKKDRRSFLYAWIFLRVLFLLQPWPMAAVK